MQEDLCGQRGLLPGTEQQTFQIAIPRILRAQYDRILLPMNAPQVRLTAVVVQRWYQVIELISILAYSSWNTGENSVICFEDKAVSEPVWVDVSDEAIWSNMSLCECLHACTY